MIICDQENIYHTPETILDTSEVMIVVCSRCKLKWEFTKDFKGRIDNNLYLDINARKFLQPKHRHYEREFGKPKALKFNEDKIRKVSRENERFDEENEERIYNTIGGNVF